MPTCSVEAGKRWGSTSAQQIDSLDRILHDLSVHFSQFRADLLAGRQFRALVSKAKGDARHPVGIAPLLQGGIVHFASRGRATC